jgi:predicted restriction endonuclease
VTPAEIRRIQRAETLEELHEWADDLLAQARRHRARHAPTRKAKAEKRAARNERMASIRDEVFKRADGRCELCGIPASEAHHVLGGPQRRERESADTVLALCQGHHRLMHYGDLMAVEQAESYCRAVGMTEAASAIRKRLDKIHEARAAGRTGT